MANFRDKAELLLMFLAWESEVAAFLEVSLESVGHSLQNLKCIDISLSSSENCL